MPKLKYLIYVVVSLLMLTTVYGKQTIDQLTSSEASKKISNKISAKRIYKGSINRHSIGFGVGQTILLGGFRDHADDSITPDLFYAYSASHSFDMLVNLHFSEHEFNDHEVKLPGLSIGIKAKLYNLDSFSPFACGGLGFYMPTVKRPVDGSLVESEEKVTFGFNFGAGADLQLNKNYTIGVIAQYHDPFDIRQEIGPRVEGSYFKLLITGYYIF